MRRSTGAFSKVCESPLGQRTVARTVPSDSPHAEEKLLAVLRQKSGAGLQILGLAVGSSFDRDRGADRIAIAFLSSQAERRCRGQYPSSRCARPAIAARSGS